MIGDFIPWNRAKDVLPVAGIQRQVNRLFEELMSGIEPPLSMVTEKLFRFTPRISIEERDEEIRIICELPGLDESDVEVLLTKEGLSLRGEKRGEPQKEGEGRVYNERSFGRFERTIPLPCEVQEDSIDAQFLNGLLTIRLPKAASAKAASRRITIRSSDTKSADASSSPTV